MTRRPSTSYMGIPITRAFFDPHNLLSARSGSILDPVEGDLITIQLSGGMSGGPCGIAEAVLFMGAWRIDTDRFDSRDRREKLDLRRPFLLLFGPAGLFHAYIEGIVDFKIVSGVDA